MFSFSSLISGLITTFCDAIKIQIKMNAKIPKYIYFLFDLLPLLDILQLTPNLFGEKNLILML
jgi:hypothetical protein